VYDASYAVLAEMLDAPLVTLDGGLASAPGVTCSVISP
jgi:predicted nucleic acid-binding protein